MKSVFSGKWITANEFLCEDKEIQNFYMKVEKEFSVGEFQKAKIKISADDYYKLYINGKYVGQGPAPGYTFAYNYNEFDITRFIISGKNKIEVTVYYQGLINRVFVSGDRKQGLICDVTVDDKLVLSSDKSWLYRVNKSYVSTHKFGYDTAFSEDRDMRIKDSEYKPCAEIECDYRFCEKPFPALSVYPVKVDPIISGNCYFYDFKQEYVCSLKITASASAVGSKIVIHCGEELEGDAVRYNLRCNCDYEEICILDKGINLIEQFDYKAFRFLEIIADDGVTVDDVQLLVRHYPFPDNRVEIKTNDKSLKAVFDLCKNTIKYGTQEVFVDCPTREKGQYLGDVFISGFSHMLLTGKTEMLKKAIENTAQSIDYSGEILAVSPCSYKQKIADYSLLFPLILLKYYDYTKDRDFLSKMLPICEYINGYFLKFADTDGLLHKVDEQWNLVDWPDNCRDNYDFELCDPIKEGKHNVVNAFYICSVENTEKIKSILGIQFENKSDDLKISFNNLFFNNETGLYIDSELSKHSAIHSNMLTIVFDICPNKNVDLISEFLIKRGMCCGTYMSYFYLKALCKAGKRDAAYNAITSDSENGWLNMIKEGATTCFEAWGKERKVNTSLFHPWSTSPIIILFEEFNEYLKF